ncbi:hypothetical protein [Elongatibacter sediminis]|uniref:Uncharacterized protein n=1 Tax=Elongatibacter sediminis TaxID=3119006 RepID=A0AAW9RHB7_9GAMM
MLTPKEVAAVLAELFTDSSYGDEGHATGGAFRIARGDLSHITGRPVWHQTIIEDVADWLVDFGLILVDRDSFFVVLRHDHFDRVRSVPDRVIEQHAHPVSYGAPQDGSAGS